MQANHDNIKAMTISNLTQTNISQELKCLRTHIVDFLIYQLQNDQITEKRASQLAQATLDQLLDTLAHDQIHQILDKLKIDFPELAKDLESAASACETTRARQIINDQILSDVSQGNIDQALANLEQVKVK